MYPKGVDSRVPCFNCTKETGRTELCHMTCEKYLEYVKINELIKKNRKKETDYRGYESLAVRRMGIARLK